MSEAAKVRLVRCPKCEKLLPEVTEFSVYQCGGCGAVLRAKNKGVELDSFSVKSDEERIGGTVENLSDRYEKMMNVSERRITDISDGSESDVRSTISSSSRADRRRIRHDRAQNNSNLMSKEEIVYHDNENGLRRSGQMGYEEEEGLWRAQRMDPKLGPSNLGSRSGYDFENVDGSNNLGYVGDERAELLKKLDELKDQLRRSGDLIDKGKEKIPLDTRVPPHDPYAYDNWYRDARPVYQDQYLEPPPLMHRQEMGGNAFYPPRYAPQGYGNPMMYRRAPPQAPHPFQISPYMDDGAVYMDPMEPYPPNFSRHHPSCPCYECLSKRRVSAHSLSTGYSDKYSSVSNDMIPNYDDNPRSHQRISNPPSMRSHTHARWPSDVNSDVDGYSLRRPPRTRLASSGKNCRPIAGGAPFLTCYNCFELLVLTKKVVTKNNSRKKLRCGGCSTVIVFAVLDKSLTVSLDNDTKDSPVKVDSKSDACVNQEKRAFASDDYDNSGYDFHSVDRESEQVSTHQGRANGIKNRHSTSTYTSEVEEDTESVTAARKDSSSADLATEEKGPPLPPGLSLQDYFEYSNKYRLAKDSGDGNRSGRSEQDKVALPNKAVINRQNLRKESTATEIDLSSNEYCNTGTTFDSSEASKEGDRLKSGRGADSFFAGIRKKSFKDSQKSNDSDEQEHANVTINGHLISNRLIKKAEKLAGPIHPGHYWYDFRAGFWGAIGGPCLGIVPPFIEQFNYPMPEHCAGGNTGVFVNGRELNHKDMNLLGSRGLPLERDRSYIIEISGRVLDEDTGEELESLGKLAPTVERMKRGFGMRAPKAAA